MTIYSLHLLCSHTSFSLLHTTCISSYILSISSLYPLYIRSISCLYPVYILYTSCLYPVYIRHPIRSSSSVVFYLRYDLTDDYRTSPVPAIYHFYFLFYYFIITMFERFMKCIVSFLYCVSLTIQYLCPASSVYPVYIRHPIRSSSSVVFYLRYDLTADYRTSPVPAIYHFFFLFYYIPFHSII